MLRGVLGHPALERFQVLEEISLEGKHRVLLAESKARSLVAIEILIDGAVPADVARTLAHEGSQAARLVDEAIVQTRAMILEDDLAAVVREVVAGVCLQRLLRFASGRGVRVPDEAAWYTLERVLTGLAHAHAQKDGDGRPAPVVHGAVGASSVVAGWDGTVKLGDFGLSRMRAAVAPVLAVSEEAALPPLMAPEQARGERATERSDVFCAALLALRLATGRTPYARFGRSAAQRMLAMSDGDVPPLSKTRPDLPQPVRDAFDRALAPDPASRAVTAQELRDIVRGSFELARGKEALAKLLERWRPEIEKSVTPWERRASIPDDAPVRKEREGILALATADERPSAGALVSADPPSEPWNKGALPKEETPLAPTDPVTSLSRVGSVASDALSMPPLPPMRVTMPSLPVYGGPPVNIPRPVPKKQGFRGPIAAVTVLVLFVLLVGGAVLMFRWLLGPS